PRISQPGISVGAPAGGRIPRSFHSELLVGAPAGCAAEQGRASQIPHAGLPVGAHAASSAELLVGAGAATVPGPQHGVLRLGRTRHPGLRGPSAASRLLGRGAPGAARGHPAVEAEPARPRGPPPGARPAVRRGAQQVPLDGRAQPARVRERGLPGARGPAGAGAPCSHAARDLLRLRGRRRGGAGQVRALGLQALHDLWDQRGVARALARCIHPHGLPNLHAGARPRAGRRGVQVLELRLHGLLRVREQVRRPRARRCPPARGRMPGGAPRPRRRRGGIRRGAAVPRRRWPVPPLQPRGEGTAGGGVGLRGAGGHEHPRPPFDAGSVQGERGLHPGGGGGRARGLLRAGAGAARPFRRLGTYGQGLRTCRGPAQVQRPLLRGLHGPAGGRPALRFRGAARRLLPRVPGLGAPAARRHAAGPVELLQGLRHERRGPSPAGHRHHHAIKFGLSMLTDAVGELLSGLGLQNDTALDFDALVQFIGAAQRVHGFTRSEQDELSAAFQKFNKHGTGELTHLQVLDLLRYLGNTTSVDEVSSLIKRVDFNGNGSMDLEEFFRLMRMMREQDMLCVRKSFDKLRSSTGQMPKRSVKAALARRGLFPQEAVLAELLQDMPAEVCFTSFMHIYDRCRFRVNLESRKRAGFSEDTVEEIASLWSCDRNLAKPTTVGELIWMFTDSHKVPVHTSEGRHQLLRRVQAARGAALEAGVPPEELENEEEPLGSASAVGFYTLVHLIRSFVRDAEQEVIDREREAVSVARFPHSEAAEFRRVFSDLAEREARRSSTCGQPAAGGGQRVDQLLTLLTRVPAIPLSALPLLLKSIGLHVPSSRLKDLKRFLAQARSRVEADEGTIRFATFLRMMRWMLDTDFADICSVMNFRRV
ncbi:unnamed protein product, partial [Prorocentrum cordatum]